MFGENSRGLIWDLKIFIFRAHIIRFLWKLADEERSRGENQQKRSFSDTQQVRTIRCKFLFFWKISGAIGTVASEILP